MKKNEQETQVLFELIAHRYETGSLIITSNQPFAEWDRIFPDQMMTVAAVDRLVHHATIIEVSSDSYRRKEALGQVAGEAATITAPATTTPPSDNYIAIVGRPERRGLPRARALGVRERAGNCRRLARLCGRDNYPTAAAAPWAEHSSRPTGSFPYSARGAHNHPTTQETLTLKNSDN